ncbi:MAG: thiamine phosphate synthase [Lysobacteraceae bacterium]|nr:MAG: thiamine phosphate synthase [Xanthomonadaceae bacterium]
MATPRIFHPPLRKGLYLVTPDEPDTDRLSTRVRAVLDQAVLLQYRNKVADSALKRRQLTMLARLCREFDVPLIVNDDPELAIDTDADGVHLGEHDGDVRNARMRLGGNAIIGVSCYDDSSRARAGADAGASYLAFGAFFTSPTKPAARRASIALLRETALFGLPRVAIGGITPENATVLIEAGAELIAVISGVFDAPDPVAAASAYRRCFD